MGWRQALVEQVRAKESYLCVGLDADWERLPKHLLKEPDPIFEFNKQIIEATHDLCVAYKPNLAFYEAMGPTGWVSLQRTLAYIPDDLFVIEDAKRGDIGNTSRLYAKAFFDTLGVDALTIAPYMGRDSVEPFLGFDDKCVILLALTSNPGSQDFQFAAQTDGQPLYVKVIRRAMEWASPDELMFVVGATHPAQLGEIRALAPEYFFLVPGVGAQGGDLAAVSKYGLTDTGGLLVNSSRGIIFAGDGVDFADKARQAAKNLQQQMEGILRDRG